MTYFSVVSINYILIVLILQIELYLKINTYLKLKIEK